MVTEHRNNGFPSHLLAETYRVSSWVVGLATVASGFLSDLAVAYGGEIAPFDVAAGVSA